MSSDRERLSEAGDSPGPTVLTRWEGQDTTAMAARLEIPSLEVLASVPSTSDRARARWEADGQYWCFVLAEEQTAGRGRRGRGWRSPSGAGVWLSVALPALAMDVDALLPLRMGMAVAQRLSSSTRKGAVRVKWPNDLLITGDGHSGGKVGGILCERVRRSTGQEAVIVGLGLNVLSAPQPEGRGGDEFPPSPLVAAAPGTRRYPVLEALIEGIRTARAHREPALSTVEMARWAELDALSGLRVRVEADGAAPRFGTARGVDASGRFLLEAGGRVEPVISGTVRPE